MSKRFALLSAAPFCLMLAMSVSAAAQEILADTNVPVVHHQRTSSNVALNASSGRLYRMHSREVQESIAKTADALPACPKAEVRLIEVFHRSASAELLDVLYYSPTNRAHQKAAAQSESRAIAYAPSEKFDLQMEFAKLVKISCLPTRFRFVDIGSKRYAEFRQGDAAWDD